MLSKSEVLDMYGDGLWSKELMPSLSYYARSAPPTLSDLGELSLGSPATWGSSGGLSLATVKMIQSTTSTNPVLAEAVPLTREIIVARLIRYTVVDPSPVLAEKKPELSILTEGRLMLNGQDDRGFVMELAPRLAELLVGHNVAREEVEYEDKEGKTKKLKSIKMSNLDIIIEVLKEYK